MFAGMRCPRDSRSCCWMIRWWHLGWPLKDEAGCVCDSRPASLLPVLCFHTADTQQASTELNSRESEFKKMHSSRKTPLLLIAKISYLFIWKILCQILLALGPLITSVSCACKSGGFFLAPQHSALAAVPPRSPVWPFPAALPGPLRAWALRLLHLSTAPGVGLNHLGAPSSINV